MTSLPVTMTTVRSEFFWAGKLEPNLIVQKKFLNFVHLDGLWNFMIEAYFSIFKIEKKRSKTAKIKHLRVVS